MKIDTIANIANDLYDNFEVAEDGEDYAIAYRDDTALNQSKVAYWREVNAARNAAGLLSWDGLLTEEYHAVLAEPDPMLRVDALIVLAATALSCAGSITRQVKGEWSEESDAEEVK